MILITKTILSPKTILIANIIQMVKDDSNHKDGSSNGKDDDSNGKDDDSNGKDDSNRKDNFNHKHEDFNCKDEDILIGKTILITKKILIALPF